MQNGVYHIAVSVPDAREEGVVVLQANSVNGGGSYLFQGRLEAAGTTLAGTFRINKWDADAPPALGLFKEIALRVSGCYDPAVPSFFFEGRVYGHHVIHIAVRGTYIAPLCGLR